MLLLILFWTLYLALHSLLASGRVKRSVERHWPGLRPWYRLLYNLVAVAGLLGLGWYQGTLPRQWLWEPSLWSGGGGVSLALSGLAIAALALRGYDLGAFAGTRQLRSEAAIDPEEGLVTEGLHRYMRHPLYTATVLLLLGWLLLRPSTVTLTAVGCMLVYLRIGIHFEEAKLMARYGEAYRSYRRKVPMLFPKVF